MKFISLLLSLAMTVTLVSQKSIKNTPNPKSLTVYTTAENTQLRLTETESVSFNPLAQPTEGEISIFVDPDEIFQTFLGIGGALTDASAETFAKLPIAKQKEFLKAYYDQDQGIGYSLIRTNIHSCDFSSGSYTYVDEGDASLKSFSIDHDKKFKLPLIKQAMAAAGGKITFYASPWSPPPFMKTNGNMLHGGKLKNEYASSWANYFVKFIKAYEKEGIPVWGITIQNEPMATQRWESCIFTAEEERDFLKNHLGPTMVKNGLAAKKIIVWDHNRDLMTHRANVIFDDPKAAKYAWGLGFHWYETWAGGQPMFENVGVVKKSYPSKNLLFTEGCVEKFSTDGYQRWSNAERYGRSMINDFNNGTVGWTDWNVLLDETGGPNHASNFCFAPIHGDIGTGDLIYTPSYYYIGHFSKFIRPGAKKISSSASRSHLLTTAFKNTNGKLAVIVMNQSDEKLKYNLCLGNECAEVNILPHAIQTLVL